MNKKDRKVYYVIITIGSLLTYFFAFWWFLGNHIPNNFSGILHALDYVLFFLLSYVVFHDILTQILFWIISRKIKHVNSPLPQEGLKVAFITTFVPGSEPHELLYKILPALVNADYPHDSWLLDEGNDEKAKEICAKFGVKYFTRKGIEKYNQKEGKFAAKTKGGNHNAWYDAHGHSYDVVAQIDTDFIPRNDFLTKTLGFFNDPQIAFVGTPQIYGNVNESFIARGAAQQSYSFYGPILRGLAGRKMTLMIGANHVVRVSALKDIGYYNAHLTEDLITGMELHSKKWRSVYVPEALAIGEGPSTWTAYFNQQMRWAFGCIDILLKHSFRLFKTMENKTAGLYFLLQQHYFTGLAMAIGLFLLSTYAIFGISPTSMDLFTMLILYIPLLLWQFAITKWMQFYFIDPKNEGGMHWAGRIISIAAWPIYFLALVGVLRGKRLVFKVTPKGANQSNLTPLSVFKPHIYIALITTVDLVATQVTGNNSVIMLFWIINIAVFMYVLLASIAIPNVQYAVQNIKHSIGALNLKAQSKKLLHI